MPDSVEKLTAYIIFAAIAASVADLVFVSMYLHFSFMAFLRFLAIVFPVWYSTKNTGKNQRRLCVLCWTAAAIVSVFIHLHPHVCYFNSRGFSMRPCFSEKPGFEDYLEYIFQIYDVIVMVSIPAFSLTYLASAIALLIKRKKLAQSGSFKAEFNLLLIGTLLTVCCVINEVLAAEMINAMNSAEVMRQADLGAFLTLSICLLFGINPWIYWAVSSKTREKVPFPVTALLRMIKAASSQAQN